MQTTIYYRERDEYLLNKVEEKANRERKSKSAVILSILEEYFLRGENVVTILKEIGELKSEKAEKLKDKSLSELKEELVLNGEVDRSIFNYAKELSEKESL